MGNRREHRAGLAFAAGAAVLWGVGGVAAQELFRRHGIEPRWLVCVRMTGAGVLLLAVLRPAWPGRQLWRLLVVSLVGVAACQYTWFAAIDHSNVATATFLQYSAVAITAGWQMARRQIRPTPARLGALAAAAGGVALLVLGQQGGLAALKVNPLGAALGLASAVSFSYYMVGSGPLVRTLGPGATTAWGLSISGVLLVPWARPWQVHPIGNPVSTVALILFVVIGSTALAFSFSLAGLHRITPTESAVTSTLEPAVAGLAGALLLGVTLLPLQYLGGALTLLAVLLLASAGRRRAPLPLPGPGRGELGPRPLESAANRAESDGR